MMTKQVGSPIIAGDRVTVPNWPGYYNYVKRTWTDSFGRYWVELNDKEKLLAEYVEKNHAR